MLDAELAWRRYQEGAYGTPIAETANAVSLPPEVASPSPDEDATDSCCGPLYISTKTKICYLNQPVPLADVFWKVFVKAYHLPSEGVIKKQMKFNSEDQAALDELSARVREDISLSGAHLEEHVISHIENPGGRIRFKDVRKISVGLCRKDVTSYRSKRKGAFYNCFVVILRLSWQKRYKEIHVKVFNTGKLEIPGIRDDGLLDRSLKLLTSILDPLMPDDAAPLRHLPERTETVLVNSNFSCNFFVDRQRLFGLLRTKYDISCSYDPCSYPGIQAEFYYRHGAESQTGQLPAEWAADAPDQAGKISKVSFMIFRTGSVLIVGKCTDDALNDIYRFICNVLQSEKGVVRISGARPPEEAAASRRARKRTITVSGSPSVPGAS